MIFPKKPQILYAPMLATFGGGSANGFKASNVPDPIAVGTLSEHYAANTAAGLQRVMLNGIEYYLNYAKYNSKGWVEVLFHGDVGEGHHQRSSFYQSYGGGYALQDENLVTSGTHSNKSLNYNTDYAQILLGTSITATDIAITSKSSRTVANIAATGQNQGSVLPLTASADMAGSSSSTTGVAPARQALIDFFKGTQAGLSCFYQNPSLSAGARSYEAYWDKGNLKLAINLYNRNGGTQTDHWQIASGEDSSNSTYYPNIGYRGQTGSSWIGRYVGSWSTWGTNGGPFPSTYYISNSNVLSIWLTDM